MRACISLASTLPPMPWALRYARRLARARSASFSASVISRRRCFIRSSFRGLSVKQTLCSLSIGAPGVLAVVRRPRSDTGAVRVTDDRLQRAGRLRLAPPEDRVAPVVAEDVERRADHVELVIVSH